MAVLRLRDMELEADFQSWVTDRAEWSGWTFYHANDPRRDVAGFPDLVLFRVGADGIGRVIFAELKRAGRNGQPTPEQQMWLDGVRACPGVESWAWWPSDRPLIEAVLT
jgi:hypothetical protein